MDTIDSMIENIVCPRLPDIDITISQYDYHDHEIGRYTGKFGSIIDSIPNAEQYYYRVTALGKNNPQKRIFIEHFGVKTSSIGWPKLSEESFINAYLNFEIKEYIKQKKLCSQAQFSFSFSYILIHDFWYENRMKTILQNTSDGFNSALNKFLGKFTEFCKIENLNDLKGKSGIYLLVLDNYNICYLGQARDLRKRIMRHWSRNDYFTGTGIDMFKALDTTRIYIALTEGSHKTNSLEHKAIRNIPSRYTLNCMAGGNVDFLTERKLDYLKEPCRENNFVNYVTKEYSIIDRINENKEKFIFAE